MAVHFFTSKRSFFFGSMSCSPLSAFSSVIIGSSTIIVVVVGVVVGVGVVIVEGD